MIRGGRCGRVTYSERVLDVVRELPEAGLEHDVHRSLLMAAVAFDAEKHDDSPHSLVSQLVLQTV
jgi:hypothetical protein